MAHSVLWMIFAHLYGLTIEDLHYILNPEDVCGKGCFNETFRVSRTTNPASLANTTLKRLVLEVWHKFNFDDKSTIVEP